MALQSSPFEFKGNIGKLNFFERNGQFHARRKGGVSASRIQNDPQFKRTRENGAEFGAAGKAGKKIRKAFRDALLQVKDGTASLRLTREMLRVLQADTVNDRGKRIVIPANLPSLEGFQFNSVVELDDILTVPFTAAIDRVTGQCTVSLESFVPFTKIPAPDGTTHFKIIAAAAAIDFDKDINPSNQQSSPDLPWSTNPTAVITLQPTVAANTTLPVFLVVGISFYQMLNGKTYPLS